LEHETQVRRLIRLAPALTLEPLTWLPKPKPFDQTQGKPVSVPTVVIHGTLDTVVPLEPVRDIVQKLFLNVKYHIVEDDHRLHKSIHELDWNSILE
jgi:predicted esterase